MGLTTLQYPDQAQAETACADQIALALDNALQVSSGRVTLLLSGGSTPARILPRLLYHDLDWGRVDTLASDERVVSASHLDSTEGMIRRCFAQAKRPLRYAGLNGHTDSSRALKTWRAARNDMVWPPAVGLIGIGPDAHIASLFPGRQEMLDLCVVDAAIPEMPPHKHPRLTLGLASLAQCPTLMLIAADEDKLHALHLSMKQKEAWPLGKLSIKTDIQVYTVEG